MPTIHVMPSPPGRIPLILAPTPLHPLPRLGKRLNVDLWIKRDDLTGFAFGGNKGRKLEYLMADVVRSGAEAVVTSGALQSNFVRQLGAACAMMGVRCVAAVMALPVLSEDRRPPEAALRDGGGNELLDELLGVDLRIFPDGTWDELADHAAAVAEALRSEGVKVYEIPVGGSSPLGAYAFFQAGIELRSQGESFDWILFASSSGSTHTGLAYAYHGAETKVLGIACDPEPELVDDFLEIYAGLESLAGEKRALPRSQWRLDLDFVGPGYGVPSAAGNDAIRTLARAEGIFLDPIYSAKAFAGLLALAESGVIGGRILFWHTGGLPALFAQRD